MLQKFCVSAHFVILAPCSFLLVLMLNRLSITVDEEEKNKDPIKVEVLTPFAEKAVAIIREKENDFPDGALCCVFFCLCNLIILCCRPDAVYFAAGAVLSGAGGLQTCGVRALLLQIRRAARMHGHTHAENDLARRDCGVFFCSILCFRSICVCIVCSCVLIVVYCRSFGWRLARAARPCSR